jgi:tetraacyldisaccharide 4'-kinase
MRFFDHKWPAILLWPLSLLYGLVIRIRNCCYDNGIFKSFAAGCTVISIGNITVGGTGKTPMVQYVVDHFMSRGKRVAIISRGYGRQSKGSLLVSDGENILCSVAEAGDEPFQLAQSCAGAIVAVDEDRVRIAHIVVSKFSPDIIVLDDAFQHRRIKRDIDIIMARSGKPVGNGFLLPAGPLREPISGLRRAHVIFARSKYKVLAKNVKRENIPILPYDYIVEGIFNKQGPVSLPELEGKDVLAFCGIANPESFHSTLAELKVNILEFKTFQDHHQYTANDIELLSNCFQRFASKFIITTEKDWVKLPIEELDDSWLFVRVRLKSKDDDLLVSRFEMLV